MKRTFLPILFILILFSCQIKQRKFSFKTDVFRLSISEKGMLTELSDLSDSKNYFSNDTLAPFLSVRFNNKIIFPERTEMNREDSTLNFIFNSDIQATVKVEEKSTHLTFELLSVSNAEKINLIIWGPYPTSINKSIGETVGVVRGEKFAIGLQALNPKTLGGYPWTDNDCMPQIDIFENNNFSDLSEEGKRSVLYRVEAAKPENFGSTLQAYCRNRNKERIISNLGHDKWISPVYDDGGIIGSKIALFGCPVEETLNIIGNIEVEEGLPHPIIDGQWGKKARSASAAYLIYDFSEKTIDQAIEYTKLAGLKYLYHSGPFKNWGHFELNEESFPNGWNGLKTCVEKAEKEGIHVGVHTLSNFITTNDPYVTPVPDSRLGMVGESLLTNNIDQNDKDIKIDNPDFFNQYQNNNLHAVKIGNELIRYRTVSENEPWRLLDCERGAFETEASNHPENEKMVMLADHGYKVFLTNPELSIEMAEKIGDLFNYCGLRQISFDGLEGNRSTGMGNYGEILFTTSWWNQLNDKIKKHTIIDASRTSHYFWHIYSRMNWGEPWYAGFRESQTEYRLKNQKYFQRNLMPGMLGWFSMRDNTSIEDIEWMLARSAAFNAGYAFVTGENQLNTNGNTPEILRLISEWEKVRMNDAFTEEQKERMQNINNEFHLQKTDTNSWNLYEVQSHKFKHQYKEKQPGEPSFSTFSFNNSKSNKTLNLIFTAHDATINNITLEINNSKSLSIPVKLFQGQSIKYSGGSTAVIFDKTWNPIRKIPVDQNILKLSKGAQTINFDCTFGDIEKEPQVKIEFRIWGDAEKIAKIDS